MKAKQYFKGLTWLLVLNLLIKPAWIFLIDREVQNTVGHAVYGTYFALYNLCFVLSFIADAGLYNLVTQRMAAEKPLNLQQLARLKLALLGLYAACCFSIAALTGVTEWTVLLPVVLIQSFTSLFVFMRGVLAARQLFTTDAVFSVVDKGLLLALCIGPVYGFFFQLTMPRFLQLQTFTSALAALSLFTFLLRKRLFTGGPTLPLTTIFTLLWPFVLLILLMSAHNRLDSFLLERIYPNGAVQAGIYAASYRLLDACNVMGYFTASFLVSFLARNQYDKPLVQKILLLTRHCLLLLAVSFYAFVFVFAPWLQTILYHTTDEYSYTIMRLCLAALPACYLTHVYGSALTATGQLGIFNWIMSMTVVINIALNVWMIPTLGAKGCCIAALVSQYGCAAALWWIASRKLSVSFSFGSGLLYLVVMVVLGLLFYLAQRITSNVWIILSSIVFITAIVLLQSRKTIEKNLFLFYK